MGWAGFNHCCPGIESRWEVIRGRTTPAHTETAERFASIISPHITSLSPLQKSTVFANLLITNPVGCLSPGAPHPLFLAGTCPAPLPYMNLVSAASFSLLLLLRMCAPLGLTLFLCQALQSGPCPQSLSHSTGGLPPWASHPSLCKIWLVPISHTLRIPTNLCINHKGA